MTIALFSIQNPKSLSPKSMAPVAGVTHEDIRWSKNIVYTRKPKKPAPVADDVMSSSIPPPVMSSPPPPPLTVSSSDPPVVTSSPSRNNGVDSVPTGPKRTISINIGSKTKAEKRILRRKLGAELDQVRSMLVRIEEFTGAQAEREPEPECEPEKSQQSVSSTGLPTAESDNLSQKPNYVTDCDMDVIDKEMIPRPDDKPEPVEPWLFEQNYDAAFKRCGLLVSKLMKHKFGWVFNSPVDVELLGLYDYYTIIREPMDLGTVKARLTKKLYDTPAEFAHDVRLTFHNAMRYNPKGQDVHFMAEQLLKIFEERWAAIEAEFAYAPLPLPPRPVAQPTTHVVRQRALEKPKAKDLYKRDMTMEERARLRNKLENLPPEKLDGVVQIIRKRASNLNQSDDEIEVDLDTMDAETLWELDRYVTNYKKILSKHKRKAELALLAKQNAERKRVQEWIPEPVAERSMMDNQVLQAATAVYGAERKENGMENPSESNNSSSSSSDSGSSSSDSDSGSSSECG